MTGSKDLPPSTKSFGSIFWHNQIVAQPHWPAPGINLSGQTAIVTGSNTGLGYEAAEQLLGLKLTNLILAVRSISRGEAAAAKLRQQHPNATIHVWELDMSLYTSIQAFAQRVQTELSHIDFVLLNAGMSRLHYTEAPSTGHNEAIQVNYISTMLLALLMLPILKLKGGSNPGSPPHLTISSAALTLAAKFPNRNSKPLLPSFDSPQTFDPREHYNSSKLLAQMFLWKLVDYVSADDVIVNLADPAWCRGTELARDVGGMLKLAVKFFGLLLGRTPKVGASCYIDAMVTQGKESHGCFLMSWERHPFAALVYTPEGKEITERVWEETLRELDFANPLSILSSMKKQDS